MSSKYPIHPKAAAYRLMHDYEFEALVEGIRTNGLLVPITLAKWVDDTNNVVEGIIDGRNRENACEVARVQPEYQHFVGSGEDGVATEEEIADYIEQTVIRKNHTLDQRAMALAILRPGAKRGPNSKDKDKDFDFTGEKFSPVEKNKAGTKEGFYRRVKFARYVQRHREDLVPGIINGTEKPISQIAQSIRAAFQKEEKEKREYEAALKELREAAPDLARDVDDQTLDLKTAQKELKQRLEDEAALEALREQSEELAEKVENDDLTLNEAEEELAKQKAYDRKLVALRMIHEELAESVDTGELTLDRAVSLSELKTRVYPDLFEAARKGEISIERAKAESNKRAIEIDRNKPPDMYDMSGYWAIESQRALSTGSQVRQQIEEHQQRLDQIAIEEIDAIIRQSLLAHEEWLKVVNLLRGQTNQKRHLDVIKGGEK